MSTRVRHFVLSAIGLPILGVLVSCSSLETARYNRDANYRSQSQGFQNYNAKRNNRLSPPKKRGPFSLTWPVETIKINRGFFRARRPHQGIDFGGKKNDAILAAHEGHVIYTGNGFSGYGKMIIIQYDETWASLYAHLNSTNVDEGDYVFKGQKIGGMGRTGRASGVHLHFELMRLKIPIDPMPLLNQTSKLVKR